VIHALKDEKIAKVVAGKESSLAIGQDGSLWLWGKGCCLGVGRDASYKALEPRRHLLSPINRENVIDACFGPTHALALTDGGRVYVWGQHGQETVLNPRLLPELLNIKWISAGQALSYAGQATQSHRDCSTL